LAHADVFVRRRRPGDLRAYLLEAMACGTPVVAPRVRLAELLTPMPPLGAQRNRTAFAAAVRIARRRDVDAMRAAARSARCTTTPIVCLPVLFSRYA